MSNPPVDPSQQGTPQAPVAEVTGMTASRGEGYTQAKVTLAIELLFVVIPFGVFFIVLALHDKTSRLWELTEFSFAGIVLGGQGVTKYISGALAKRKTNAKSEPYALLISVAAVVLIFLAGIVLYRIVEVREAMEGHLSMGLIICQILIFLGGIVIFILLGGAGEVARIRFEKG